jgi:hypothetical protein
MPIVLPARTARTDGAVRTAIEHWVGILVEQKFDDAMATLGPSGSWSAELLAQVIANYGSVEPREDGRTSTVTPIAAAVGAGPRFEVRWFNPPITNRLGYAPDRLGHASFDLPLDGRWSDVTATFDILDLPGGAVLTLDDVHVM